MPSWASVRGVRRASVARKSEVVIVMCQRGRSGAIRLRSVEGSSIVYTSPPWYCADVVAILPAPTMRSKSNKEISQLLEEKSKERLRDRPD